VAERRRTEDALRRTEAELRRVMDRVVQELLSLKTSGLFP